MKKKFLLFPEVWLLEVTNKIIVGTGLKCVANTLKHENKTKLQGCQELALCTQVLLSRYRIRKSINYFNAVTIEHLHSN